MRHSIIGLTLGALLAVFAQAAHAAQNQAPPPPPDLLAGPKVEPQATQQRNNPGRPNAGPNEGKREFEIPFQQWMSALRGLGLSQDQQDTVRDASSEFQGAMRGFMDEHGEELRVLSVEMREARRDGKEPPKESREKLRQIEESRPKPDPYKERIWTVLTEQQQGEMKERLQAMRERMNDRRDDRRDGPGPVPGPGRGARRPGVAPGQAGPGPGPDDMQPMGERPPGDEMMPPPMNAEDRPEMNRPGQPRGPGRWSGGTALDERGRARLEFLRAHQSTRRPGWGPSDAQRHFEFDPANNPPPPVDAPRDR